MLERFSMFSVLGLFFFQAEDGIRDLVRSRGLGDVYKRQPLDSLLAWLPGDMVAATARTLRAGVRVGAAIGVGLAVLALAATALRLHEFTSVRARIMARLRRTK